MSETPDVTAEGVVPEEQSSLEGLDDLQPVSERLVTQAVVSGTDWTAETIISQINKGNIQLNPKFQRREAWDSARKSRFIESLILGLPVPQIVLAESDERKGSYIVIDGKQRLLSIRQFAASAEGDSYTRLRLTGLAIAAELNKKSLADLRSDPQYANEVSAFENQPVRTVVIKNWQTESFLYQVFLRLNTGSVPLSPQELRQALHPGPFVDYADRASSDSPALRELLHLKRPDFRMRDVELFIRYIAFSFFLNEYSGDLKSFLDLTCARLNTDWTERKDEIEIRATELEAAYQTARAVFTPKYVFRKWTGDQYEGLLNRAIFDAMMYAFSDVEVRKRAAKQPANLEKAFKTLCEKDTAFLNAIERTTKSLDATAYRLARWTESVNSVLGTDRHVPSLDGGRIS